MMECIPGYPSDGARCGSWKEWDGRPSRGYPLTEAAMLHRSGLGLSPRPFLRSSVLGLLSILAVPHACASKGPGIHYSCIYTCTHSMWLPCTFCQASAQKSSAQKEPPWPLSKFLTLSLSLLGPRFIFLHYRCCCCLVARSYLTPLQPHGL